MQTHRRSALANVLIGSLAVFAIGSASAQSPAPAPTPAPTLAPTPATDPSLTDPSLDDALDRPRRTVTDEVVAPMVPRKGPAALPSVPGLSSIDYKLPNRKFLPEGTLLTALVGTIVRSPMGDVIFLPDITATDAAGAKIAQTNAPAMVLLPTQKLSQLAAATRDLEPATRVAVSGHVYVYRDRQFLLPTAFAVRPTVTAPPQPATSTPPTRLPAAAAPSNTKPSLPAAPAADPRIEDLIQDLETMRGPARVMDPTDPDPSIAATPSTPPAPGLTATTPPGATPPDAPREGIEALTREGTLIVNRRGRLTRSAATGGRIAMAFDNDPDSPGPGTMMILPCALLRSMEEVVATKGDDTAFQISGRVLVYDGQNYLLPVLFQARQTLDIRPQQ